MDADAKRQSKLSAVKRKSRVQLLNQIAPNNESSVQDHAEASITTDAAGPSVATPRMLDVVDAVKAYVNQISCST